MRQRKPKWRVDIRSADGFVRLSRGVVCPRVITWRTELRKGQVEAAVVVEIVDGSPVAKEVRLTGDGVRSSDLRHVDVGELVKATPHAFPLVSEGPGVAGPPATWAQVGLVTAAATKAAGKARQRVTKQRLGEVAAVYLASGGQIAEVSAKCHVSRSQAYRLVASARAEGLLPDG